jgi:hypothetical protein
MVTIGQYTRRQAAEPVKERLQAVVILIHPNLSAIAQLQDGATVLLPAWGEVKTAQIGDTYSFIPEQPNHGQKASVSYFGRSPALVHRMNNGHDWSTDEPKHAPGLTLSFEPPYAGLPDHHARHFDQHGNLIFPPRPCDLDAQRRALRTTGA